MPTLLLSPDYLFPPTIDDRIRMVMDILHRAGRRIDHGRAAEKLSEACAAMYDFATGSTDPNEGYNGEHCPLDRVRHGFFPGQGDDASWLVLHAIDACQMVLGLSKRIEL